MGLGPVMEGLVFGESARWHDGRLWVCDWGTGEVLAMAPGGRPEVIVRAPSYPLCIDWLPDGRLLVVSGGDGRLLRMEPDGSTVVHAELGGLSDERWNEVAVGATGTAFVNGGPGIIAAVTPDGPGRRVADALAFPNGMVVTPDGSTLIVAESHANRLTAFDVAADGALMNRRVWADLAGDNPDGICLDVEGAVWYADVPHKRCRRVREGGEILQTVEVNRGCFSCALSDGAQPQLFVVATEWRGFEHMFDGPRTGTVLALEAPSPSPGQGTRPAT